MDDLPCEGDTHLDSQCLEECQEEGQHLICHFWKKKKETSVNPKSRQGLKTMNLM